MVSHSVGLIWTEVICLLKKILRAFAWAQLWNLCEFIFHLIPIILARAIALLGNLLDINRTHQTKNGHTSYRVNMRLLDEETPNFSKNEDDTEGKYRIFTRIFILLKVICYHSHGDNWKSGF